MLGLDNLYLNKQLKLVVKDVKNTYIRELTSFTLFLNTGELIARCSYFRGRGAYTPWLEMDYNPILRNKGLEVNLFKIIYNILEPNSKLFVTYIRDIQTITMLYKGVHPVETPLGFSLLSAGFTWFKNWYFPEGGNEGFPKLQGNKPLSTIDAIRQLEEIKKEVKNDLVKIKVDELIDNYRKSGNRLIHWEIT